MRHSATISQYRYLCWSSCLLSRRQGLNNLIVINRFNYSGYSKKISIWFVISWKYILMMFFIHRSNSVIQELANVRKYNIYIFELFLRYLWFLLYLMLFIFPWSCLVLQLFFWLRFLLLFLEYSLRRISNIRLLILIYSSKTLHFTFKFIVCFISCE